MKVFITGGAGFIGSHVTDLFIENGHEVTIIDHCLLKKKYFINPKAKLIKKSINHPKVMRALKEEQPDIVCHLAAQISAPYSVNDPTFDAQVNITDSLLLAKTCAEIGVKKFIYASSGGAMYGETPSEGADENFPTNPLSPYGLSKMTFEQYLQLFGTLYNLPWISLRLSNVYGPRQQVVGEAGVVAIFLNNIINNQQSSIFGDGEARRDFIFVEDVARSFMLASDSDIKNKGINIGTGSASSVNDLWSALNNYFDNKHQVIHQDPRPGDVQMSVLNPSLAKDLLNFEAEIPFKQGLEKTAEWYIENN